MLTGQSVSRLSLSSTIALAASLSLLDATATASEQVLYAFHGGSDGFDPVAGVTMDKSGDLFGTTEDGGGGANCHEASTFGCGTIFEVASDGTESVLHAFAGGCDGWFPAGNLLRDKQSNLYGTTEGGGTCSSDIGNGTVFKLSPNGTETVLYAFQGTTDGSSPLGNLARDTGGNLFGVTQLGGNLSNCGGFGCGTVFKLSPGGTETVLHTFQGGSDGMEPMGGVLRDRSGNLYGTTIMGGSASTCPEGCGTVFEVAASGVETVLYSFQGNNDGYYPRSSVILDSSGNLFGTTEGGGTSNQGTVFKVTPGGVETILYSFKGGTDGDAPLAGLVADKSGNLYGTTYLGGNSGCNNDGQGGCGTVFRIAPDGTEKLLYVFPRTHGQPHGAWPSAPLLLKNGYLFGTAIYGGTNNNGVVFKLRK